MQNYSVFGIIVDFFLIKILFIVKHKIIGLKLVPIINLVINLLFFITIILFFIILIIYTNLLIWLVFVISQHFSNINYDLLLNMIMFYFYIIKD